MNLPAEVVYFIRHPVSGAIKIGTTTNLSQRLIDLRATHRCGLEVIGYIEGGVKRERELHLEYRQHHIRAEWFEPNPRLLELIDRKSLPLSELKRQTRTTGCDSPKWAPFLKIMERIPVSDLIKSTGCTPATASNWKAGKTIPNADAFVCLIRDFEDFHIMTRAVILKARGVTADQIVDGAAL